MGGANDTTPDTGGDAPDVGKRAVVEEHVTHGASETEAVARRFAAAVEPGTFVLLHGDLGAGKTAFVRGLASGLGADPEMVSSPTFTIVQEYRGRVRVQHVDLYRLSPGFEIDELGLEEFAARGDVIAVEWAERLTDRPSGAVTVHIATLDDTTRRITLSRGADEASGT